MPPILSLDVPWTFPPAQGQGRPPGVWPPGEKSRKSAAGSLHPVEGKRSLTPGGLVNTPSSGAPGCYPSGGSRPPGHEKMCLSPRRRRSSLGGGPGKKRHPSHRGARAAPVPGQKLCAFAASQKALVALPPVGFCHAKAFCLSSVF